jgi:hypothetical protein
VKPQKSLKRVAGLIALGGCLALGAWFLPKAFRTGSVVTPAPNITLEPVFSYWVMVQKYRNGKPYQLPFRLAGEINFENDYHIRLHVKGEREGFLYIINEGPVPVTGLPDYNILFPSPTANNGSAQLARNQQIAIPETGDGFFFDQEQGTEKLWLVWSKKSLPDLEAVKSLANPLDKGSIRNPAQIESVRHLLNQQTPATGEKNDARKDTVLVLPSSQDTSVYRINLEHH